MRHVKFQDYNSKTREWEDHEGFFHQWAATYETFENGAGNYTVAIVEDNDGKIYEVLPSKMLFKEEKNCGPSAGTNSSPVASPSCTPQQAAALKCFSYLLPAVVSCQSILARYIVPDSGMSDRDCINELLQFLDNSNLVAAVNNYMVNITEQQLAELNVQGSDATAAAQSPTAGNQNNHH